MRVHFFHYGLGIGFLAFLVALLLLMRSKRHHQRVETLRIDSVDAHILRFWHRDLLKHFRTSAQTNPHTKIDSAVWRLPRLDLNTATAYDLRRIRGIGKVRSRRIVAYRKVLGGFYSMRQLNEVYGLPDEVIHRLNEIYTIRDSMRCCVGLNVNRLSEDKLRGHPYLRIQNRASRLVKERQKAGPYRSMKDLQNRFKTTDEAWTKLRHYLVIDSTRRATP